MSDDATTPEPRKPAALKPRDAATLIIIDRTGVEPRVLMGKRRMDQVFMPGKFVFPGGRVDKEDRVVAAADELRAGETAKLLLDMKGAPSAARARSLALAAVRETFEEAGVIVGSEGTTSADGLGESWSGFIAQGLLPKLSALTFFARAITPPGRPRRFDTRFFCVDHLCIARTVPPPHDELSGVNWFTMAQARELDLPPITRVVLEDLLDRIKAGRIDDAGLAVPYYHFKNGSFRRELLSLEG